MSKSKPLPLDRQALFVDDAVYTEYDLASVSDEDYARLMYGQGAIDAFCRGCNRSSVFNVEGLSYGFSEKLAEVRKSGIVNVVAKCGRNKNSLSPGCSQEIHICFYRNWNTLTKIGQYPSKADLDFGGLDPVFSRELNKGFREELGKAIGLRAHGIGIDSFVYLRRIFERLRHEAHLEAQKDNLWDEAKESLYNSGRMREKIQLLGSFLPNRLVTNAPLYGILSRGVHELSEEECLEYFDLVRNAILMILKQRHEDRVHDQIVKGLHGASGRIGRAGDESAS